MAALTVQSSGFFPNCSKDSIPIVHNVVSDRDLSRMNNESKVLPEIGVTEINLTKVLKLITDKHSKNLVDRHFRAVKKLSSYYRSGIHLNDVPSLLEILKKCHDNIVLEEKYEELVCILISILRKPFLKSKTSDEAKHLDRISEFLTSLGVIGESSSDKIKICMATTMSSLYTTKAAKELEHLDFKPVSPKFLKCAIEKSRICKSIAERLGQISDDNDRYTLLRALNQLSTSDLNCDDILKTDAASIICCRLINDINDYRFLFVDVEILWNLLEHGNVVEFSRQLSCESCLRSLLSAFIYQMNHCTSIADRQLRNDLLVIIILIASKCPEAPFVVTGVTKMISLFSTYPEVPSRHEHVRNVKIQPSPVDFELKKLFLSAVTLLSSDKASIKVMQQHYILLGLFSFVQPITDPVDTIWSVAEFEELQLLALAVLSSLAPHCIQDYLSCQGGTRLLSLLDWCIGIDDFGGHGNSYHGTGGRGSKRAQMRLCMRLIRSMCTTGDEKVCQDFTDQGLITQLVAILSSCSMSTESNDAVDIELQCDMLFILAALCDGDMHRKELFGEAGVKMLIQYLDGYVNTPNGPLAHTKLILSTTHCIWSAIINCYMNEVVFLEKEGAFLLLDLLEGCTQNMRSIVMGTLLDLTENKNALPHIMLWRGKCEKTTGKLLIEMWIDEERILGVERDSFRVIHDSTRPLMTQEQELQGIIPLPVTYASPSIGDVSDNLRAKIYSLFTKIGFNNVPGLLSPDYVTLCLIEKYLDFKTYEIWQEIKIELELEGIEPVAFDKEGIQFILKTFQDKAFRVQEVQRALIDSNFEQDVLDEREFYDKIKGSYKQADKSYEDFVNFVERTSDFTVLQRAREQQLQSIDRSRLLSRSSLQQQRNLVSHETIDRSLTTTTFCGRKILVKSMMFGTPIESSKQSSIHSQQS